MNIELAIGLLVQQILIFIQSSIQFIQESIQRLFLKPPYLPFIGFGFTTWTIWLIRRLKARSYEPSTANYRPSASVIIPVYNESEEVLSATLERILANRPDEVIAVIDWTNPNLVDMCARKFPTVKTITMREPGKRPALAEGIRAAKREIVVLVDSDTYWLGDNFLEELLKPFADSKIGAVGSRQNVANVNASLFTRIADMWLNIKFHDYLTGNGSEAAVTCESGRTAAYRRSVVLPLLPDMVNETFLGRKCVGGDDGRLTSLVLRAGYGTAYQYTAHALTVFPPKFKDFVKQRIRWARNSYRCYFRAIKEGWLFGLHWIGPLSVIHMLISPFMLLASVIFTFVALYLHDYLVAAVLILWAITGRTIKLISHLRIRPRDLVLLPVYEAVNRLVMTSIKVYALFTCYKQEWLGTRGDYKLEKRLGPSGPPTLFGGFGFSQLAGKLKSGARAMARSGLHAPLLARRAKPRYGLGAAALGDKKYCHDCGVKLRVSAHFCSICGQKQLT